MDWTLQLWKPILLSTALVFIASFLVWSVFPWHKRSYKGHPKEADTLDNLRGLPSGIYLVPFAGCDTKPSEEFMQKWKAGPTAVMHVSARPRSMGACMLATVLVFLVISFFVAYILVHALPLNGAAQYLQIFQLAGAAAFAAHALGGVVNGIWFGKPVSQIAWEVVDGLIYGLLTAGSFAWLWPTRAE